MIANNIDGSIGSANQLLELLSNPAAYEKQIKALQEAAEESKKYVELVAPASDILALKDKLRAEKEELDVLLDNAKKEAADRVASAKAEANSIVDGANKKAEEIVKKAADLEAQALEKISEATAKINESQKSKVYYDELKISLSKKLKDLEVATSENLAAKEQYEAKRSEIIAKHKAFIESL